MPYREELGTPEWELGVEVLFEPVRPPTTFEETVERLGTAVRLGLLTPGSRLPSERSLASQLGISRSTLRQALTTLEETGHLVSSRGRKGGIYVAEQPPLRELDTEHLGEEARAVLDQRVAIEIGATVLAAERGTTERLDRLDLLVKEMASAQEFEYYRRVDYRFHIGVAEAARSPQLVKAMIEVQGQMSDLISMIPHPEQVLTHANEQHRQLVTLLRRGDSVRAMRLMRMHLEGTEHILAGLI
jgi:GntR family transcriptional repressor for pyruvate dehydrogenase complex